MGILCLHVPTNVHVWMYVNVYLRTLLSLVPQVHLPPPSQGKIVDSPKMNNQVSMDPSHPLSFRCFLSFVKRMNCYLPRTMMPRGTMLTLISLIVSVPAWPRNGSARFQVSLHLARDIVSCLQSCNATTELGPSLLCFLCRGLHSSERQALKLEASTLKSCFPAVATRVLVDRFRT